MKHISGTVEIILFVTFVCAMVFVFKGDPNLFELLRLKAMAALR